MRGTLKLLTFLAASIGAYIALASVVSVFFWAAAHLPLWAQL